MGIGQNHASGASLDSISWNVLIIIRTRMPNSHAIWPSMWTWWTVDCTALMEAQDISSLSVSLIHCISPREPGPVWQRRCITRCAGQSGTSTYQHFHQYLPANPDQVHRCTESELAPIWSDTTQSNQNISTNDIEYKVEWSPGSCRSCTRIFSSSKKDASLGKTRGKTGKIFVFNSKKRLCHNISYTTW